MEGGTLCDAELKEIASQLQSAENDAEIIGILQRILSKKPVELDIVDSITLLLQSDNIEIRCLSATTIAELLKCETNRATYSKIEIVNSLTQFISEPIDSSNAELIKQTCRALGNMCCDCTAGLEVISMSEKISLIIELIPKTLKCSDELKERCAQVRSYACKVLLNYLLGGVDYIKPALDLDLIKYIHQVLIYEVNRKTEDEDCLNTALVILSVLTDEIPSIVFENDLNLLVVKLLRGTSDMETSELCLVHLHTQAQHDSVKSVLANDGVVQLLWSLLQEHRSLVVDEETRRLMKLACDLIVLILTGDEPMHMLYGDGKGEVYLAMIEWLGSDDAELVTTAVLAVGNFARTDTQCVHMMDSGVFTKLLSILSAHKVCDDDIRLQHAVLSALRNLVIPQRNKPLAIEYGILPVLIEILPNVSQYHVVFRLLATLRMLVDGQESVAEQLVASGVLAKVCHWGSRAEHAGAAGEAPRLIAWIIRQLHTTTALKSIVEVEGCVGCLVSMLVATHAIMQNEAIMSLTILCVTNFPQENTIEDEIEKLDSVNLQDARQMEDKSTITASPPDRLTDELIKAELGRQLNTLIEAYISKMQAEIIENFSKFLTLIVKREPIRRHLHSSDVHVSLNAFIESNSPNVPESAKLSIENIISEIRNAQT